MYPHLITHSDNDHYSVPTCRDLAGATREYHSTQYVASLMKQEGLPAYGHDIGEHFAIGRSVWRSRPPTTRGRTSPSARAITSSNRRTVADFWIDTPGRDYLGAWRFTAHPRSPPAHAQRRCHAVRLLRQRLAFRTRRRHRDGQRLPIAAVSLGSVNATDFPPFNADRESLPDRVENSERIQVLVPGEPFLLRRLQS